MNFKEGAYLDRPRLDFGLVPTTDMQTTPPTTLQILMMYMKQSTIFFSSRFYMQIGRPLASICRSNSSDRWTVMRFRTVKPVKGYCDKWRGTNPKALITFMQALGTEKSSGVIQQIWKTFVLKVINRLYWRDVPFLWIVISGLNWRDGPFLYNLSMDWAGWLL